MDVTQNLIKNGTDVEWVIAYDGFQEVMETFGNQFYGVKSVFGDSLTITTSRNPNEIGESGKIVLCARTGDQMRCWASLDPDLGINENWGTSLSPIITTKTLMGLIDFQTNELKVEDLLQGNDTSSISLRLINELDGNVQDFGAHFVRFLHNNFPEIEKKIVDPSISVKRLIYSDRYLRSPLHLLLLTQIVQEIAGENSTGDVAVEIRSAEYPVQPRPPFRVFHNFQRQDECVHVLYNLLANTSDDVSVLIENKKSMRHARTLFLKFSDASTYEIDFDQGMGAWNLYGVDAWRTRFNYQAQADSLLHSDGRAEINGPWGTVINIRKSDEGEWPQGGAVSQQTIRSSIGKQKVESASNDVEESTKIRFPSGSKLSSIFEFCTELNSLSSKEKIVIDFHTMGRVDPFCLAYTANHIRGFKKQNPSIELVIQNYDTDGYAAHMGFFHAFGFEVGNELGEAKGSENYLPLTLIDVQTIQDESTETWESEQKLVEKEAENLAEVLSRQSAGDLFDTLAYSIREIVRNVIEHSDSRVYTYCAQYWPKYKKVEIAILDSGIGLKQSISQNPFIDPRSDVEAIQQVLMPAISSKNYKGAAVDTDDPWHNSGFGLYMTSRLCRNGGNFFICSGKDGVYLDETGKTQIELGHNFQGTAVRLYLDTSRLVELSQMLRKFREEGFEVAKQIKGIGHLEASAASLMLSRDFKS